MKTLRLLLTSVCNRSCPGCCNKDWDLKNLPKCISFKGYDEIILTGGEPMLFPSLLRKTISRIRRQTKAPIYIYTAHLENIAIAKEMFFLSDGLTVTLHEQEDILPWKLFNEIIPRNCKSLRLNVFSNVKITHESMKGWKVKRNIEWIKNCPLPKNEVFMRI